MTRKEFPLIISICECKSREEIESTYPIMDQLRPHITFKDYFSRIFTLMQKENYGLLAAYTNENQCIGAAGFQQQTRLSLGNIIYLADLVTDKSYRSQGVGSQLLAQIKQEAISQNLV